MSHLAIALTLVILAGFGLTVFKLLQTKLARSYRAFFAFCWFHVLQSGLVVSIGVTSDWYFKFWAVSLPVFWAICILSVHELCDLVLDRYRGLRTAGRWGMYAAVVIAAAISILTLLPKLKTAQQSRILPYLYRADRGVTLGLALFLLVMMFLLSRFPVKPNRNVIVHAAVYTLFFLGSAAVVLIRTFWGTRTPAAVDIAWSALQGVSAWCWFLLLSKRGEETQMNVPRYTAEQEERILLKLESLNATLLKVSHN